MILSPQVQQPLAPVVPPPSRAIQLASTQFSLLPRTVEAMALGMVITDATRADNPIVYCNPGFERLTGYTADEVVGRNCRLLQGPDTDRTELAKLRQTVAEGRGGAVVLKNYRKDRTPFWNALNVTPLTDPDGRVTHFVGVQTDITAVKELEAQFLQAQKMELVGRLTGAVAHDFNNLLTVISGFTETARDVLDRDHPACDMLAEVAAAGKRAAGLTRQLLTFSRKGTGRNTRADLNAAVSGCEGMLRKLVGPNVELVVRLDPAAGFVPLDTGRVEQVVMNLAVNARDAMPGGGRLAIETAVTNVAVGSAGAPAERFAVVRVADTGHGMDAATLSRAFEPFFTTKPAGRGTGLGLSTVLDLARGVGGDVRAESEPGRGTEFRVYLPRVVPQPTDPLPDSSAEYRVRGSEVVLVVDGDAPVRAVMGLALRARGYTVLEAPGAPEALAMVREHPGPIHLVVTDVMMPV
ncbi:MAG: PAS domain-containing protein, partial [Planctomycetes bacterium]|nr:PAS domain-containing protein [Planctomycetota bacterium]